MHGSSFSCLRRSPPGLRAPKPCPSWPGCFIGFCLSYESPGRSDLQAGAFAGSSIELAAVESPVVLKARRASGRKASNGSQHTTAPPGSARASPQRCNAAGSSWPVWNTGIILPAPRRLSVLPAWQVELNRRRSRALASGWVMLTLFLGPSRALISASRRTSLYWGLLLICILSARGLTEKLAPRERQAPAATAASSKRCSRSGALLQLLLQLM